MNPNFQSVYGEKEREFMASNFKISAHRNNVNLHLKLMGDFDGGSAFELINMIKKNTHGVHKVFIHTNCLKHIYPFGRDIFQKNLGDLNGHSISILYTGEKADKIAPANNSCL
jgi:hypothetical protein